MKLDTDTHFKVISLLEKAVLALRESGAPQDDIKRVHTLMLKTQASYDDYKESSFSADISEPVESARHSFRDRPLMECIYGLAANYKPPSFKSLEDQAKDLQEKYPMQYLITKHLHERLGSNFRNRLAHGLVTDNEYAS